MRIIMTRSNPVNPDPRVEKELNSLLKHKYIVRVLAWERDAGEKNEKRNTLSVLHGKVPINLFFKQSSFGRGIANIWSLFLFQLYLLRKLFHYRKDYDVIHACDFDTVIPAYLISTVFKKKIVYDIFDYYVDAFRIPVLLKPLIEKLDIYIIDRADAVIIANESRKEQMRKSSRNDFWIIHNSPDKLAENIPQFELKSSSTSNSERLKLVYVGVLSGSRFLVELAEIISRYKEIELHIGGYGDLESYFKKVDQESDNIHFYGKLNYDSALSLSSHSDLLFAIYDPVIPNHRYSSPNKLYEAMVLKKPIIVAKNTGIDVLVGKYQTGFIVEYDKEQVELLIKKLIETNRNRFKDMGLQAYTIYVSDYSWSIMEKRLIQLYEQLEKKE